MIKKTKKYLETETLFSEKQWKRFVMAGSVRLLSPRSILCFSLVLKSNKSNNHFYHAVITTIIRSGKTRKLSLMGHRLDTNGHISRKVVNEPRDSADCINCIIWPYPGN